MSDNPNPKKSRGTADELAHMMGSMAVGVKSEVEPRLAPTTLPPSATPRPESDSEPDTRPSRENESTADDASDELVPTLGGMVPADAPSKLTVLLTARLHFEFRQFVRSKGVSFSQVVDTIARASIKSGELFTEEDLLWLAEQKQKRR